MADRGQLTEALGMQKRAVAMREGTLLKAETEEIRQGLVFSLRSLSELQERAGLMDEAKESAQRCDALQAEQATP